jgi:hypothetical protein
MGGTGHADGWVIRHVSGNKADAVPCERLQLFYGRFSWVVLSSCQIKGKQSHPAKKVM